MPYEEEPLWANCLLPENTNGGGATPEGFAHPAQILTASGTWTCPRTGTYQISCIASGGPAEVLLESDASGRQGIIAGGGAGGIAESQLKISKGAVIPVTVSEAVTSFGNYLSASSGQNGYINETAYGAITESPGNGGNASGGNIGNYTGGNGYIETSSGIIGGSTNSNAKYGNSSGNEACMNIMDDRGCTVVLTVKKEYGKSQYGVGQGECTYHGQVGSNRYGKVTSTQNGAIAINFIK